MKQSEQVKAFHKAFNIPVRNTPGFPSTEERRLRIALLREEFQEYLDAETSHNLVEVADGLVDMMYIIHGTALSYGLPIDIIFDEVHRSNMSKLDENGLPLFREDGKVLKGPNYFRPNIDWILEDADTK